MRAAWPAARPETYHKTLNRQQEAKQNEQLQDQHVVCHVQPRAEDAWDKAVYKQKIRTALEEHTLAECDLAVHFDSW